MINVLLALISGTCMLLGLFLVARHFSLASMTSSVIRHIGLSFGQWVILALGLAAVAAGWIASGFYVVTGAQSPVYRLTDENSLQQIGTAPAGTYLRLVRRDDFWRAGQRGALVNYVEPGLFDVHKRTRTVNAAYLEFGILGGRFVAAKDVDAVLSILAHERIRWVANVLYVVGSATLGCIVLGRVNKVFKAPAESYDQKTG
jgi:hypothetical protein